MSIPIKILILVSIILFSCQPTKKKNEINKYATKVQFNTPDSTEGEKKINNSTDSCIIKNAKSKSVCLSNFLNSNKQCERGYFLEDSSNYLFKKVFLKGVSKYYTFAFFEKDSLSKIYTLINGKWLPFHSLLESYDFFPWQSCQCDSSVKAVPDIRFVDFNGDNYLDIQIINATNMNGNEYSYICMTDTINKNLLIFNHVFSNPEYNRDTKRLQEVEWSSVTRDEYHVTYKWKDLTLYPEYKLLEIRSESDWSNPPKGMKFNIYRGTGLALNDSSDLTLIKSYKDPPEKIYSKWYKIAGIK